MASSVIFTIFLEGTRSAAGECGEGSVCEPAGSSFVRSGVDGTVLVAVSGDLDDDEKGVVKLTLSLCGISTVFSSPLSVFGWCFAFMALR
jgi:hypothetical protein